jgi:Ca2+-dependent lipid-binding protein
MKFSLSIFSGYFQFSIFWILLFAVSYYLADRPNQDRQVRFELFKEASENERDAILTRLGNELPSWVQFPDKERAEFLNKLVRQAWPHAKSYITKLAIGHIESILNQTSNGAVKIDELNIGDLPPRIGGVKVYTENVGSDEIMIDVQILLVNLVYFLKTVF